MDSMIPLRKEILDKVKEEKDAAVFAYTAKYETRLKSQMQKLKKHMRRLMNIRKAKDNMKKSVRTAGLTVNRTEPFLGGSFRWYCREEASLSVFGTDECDAGKGCRCG